MFLPLSSVPVAVSSEYGTGSEEDTLWVLASVAGGSAKPWKTEHLAASWTGSLPGCPGARWPRATTARSPQTSTGQMAPSPTRDRPTRPDRCHPVQLGGGGGLFWLSHLSWKVFIVCVHGGKGGIYWNTNGPDYVACLLKQAAAGHESRIRRERRFSTGK